MTEITDRHVTPDNPTRRSAMSLIAAATPMLAGASGLAIADTAGNLETTPSKELLAWRHARVEYWSAVGACKEHGELLGRAHLCRDDLKPAVRKKMWDTMAFLDGDQRYSELDAAMGAAQEKLDAIVEVIKGRPVRSVNDLAELAEMVRGEMLWNPGERDPDDDNAPHPEAVALFDAIEALAKGWIVS
jgi:hypothetical protein